MKKKATYRKYRTTDERAMLLVGRSVCCGCMPQYVEVEQHGCGMAVRSADLSLKVFAYGYAGAHLCGERARGGVPALRFGWASPSPVPLPLSLEGVTCRGSTIRTTTPPAPGVNTRTTLNFRFSTTFYFLLTVESE